MFNVVLLFFPTYSIINVFLHLILFSLSVPIYAWNPSESSTNERVVSRIQNMDHNWFCNTLIC